MRTPEDIRFINEEIDGRQEKADTAAKQATETYRILSGQLILVCGMVISFSSALSLSQYAANLGPVSRIMLASAWICLALSIIFGFLAHFKDKVFFTKWQDYQTEVAKELAMGKYTMNTARAAAEKFSDLRPKTQSPEWPLWWQVGFLALGSMLFFVVILNSFLKL